MTASRPRRQRAYHLVCLLLDLLVAATCRVRADLRTVPRSGPLLVLPNHLSVLDPLVIGTALHRIGRTPRFVITEGVMTHRLLGPLLRWFDHIPIDRSGVAGAAALDPVIEALRHGECVVLYPEGKVIADPAASPGRGLPGAAWAAAEAGAPVVVLAQWGSHRLWHRGSSSLRALPPRRARIVLTAQPPIQVEGGRRGAVRATRSLMAGLGAAIEEVRSTDRPIAR